MHTLWTIALPTRHNDDALGYWRELEQFEREAIRVAGGYTNMGARPGAWRDPATGRVYTEQMRGYQIVATGQQMDALVDIARNLFPDQIAFYVAKIGTATFKPGRKVT